MSINKDITMNSICKNALSHFSLERHNNIKKSIIKKMGITMTNEKILQNLCFINEGNNILLDYRYFKCFISTNDYDTVFQYFYNLITKILETNETFNIHVYIKSLSIIDIDKYYTFISKISQIMKDAFPDKLGKCYIYNASFIFSQLIKIISKFVDKKTQDKIELIDE
jgi:hypothetical protein